MIEPYEPQAQVAPDHAELRERVDRLPARWIALADELDRIAPGREERRATLDVLPRHQQH